MSNQTPSESLKTERIKKSVRANSSNFSNTDTEKLLLRWQQPIRLAKTLAKDRIRNLSSSFNSFPSSELSF